MNTLVMNPLQPCPADYDIPFVHMTPSTLLANLVLLHFLSSVFFIFFLYCHYQFKTHLITLESLLTKFWFFVCLFSPHIQVDFISSKQSLILKEAQGSQTQQFHLTPSAQTAINKQDPSTPPWGLFSHWQDSGEKHAGYLAFMHHPQRNVAMNDAFQVSPDNITGVHMEEHQGLIVWGPLKTQQSFHNIPDLIFK